MFLFVTRHIGFLKHIPFMGMVFDGLLRLHLLLTRPQLLNYIDNIEFEVLSWKNTIVVNHKYGGIQFNYGNKELGHIHSNGLLDLLLTRKQKQLLVAEGRVSCHHTFKNSGWISFYICNDKDKEYALKLLKIAYMSRHPVLVL